MGNKASLVKEVTHVLGKESTSAGRATAPAERAAPAYSANIEPEDHSAVERDVPNVQSKEIVTESANVPPILCDHESVALAEYVDVSSHETTTGSKVVGSTDASLPFMETPAPSMLDRPVEIPVIQVEAVTVDAEAIPADGGAAGGVLGSESTVLGDIHITLQAEVEPVKVEAPAVEVIPSRVDDVSAEPLVIPLVTPPPIVENTMGNALAPTEASEVTTQMPSFEIATAVVVTELPVVELKDLPDQAGAPLLETKVVEANIALPPLEVEPTGSGGIDVPSPVADHSVLLAEPHSINVPHPELEANAARIEVGELLEASKGSNLASVSPHVEETESLNPEAKELLMQSESHHLETKEVLVEAEVSPVMESKSLEEPLLETATTLVAVDAKRASAESSVMFQPSSSSTEIIEDSLSVASSVVLTEQATPVVNLVASSTEILPPGLVTEASADHFVQTSVQSESVPIESDTEAFDLSPNPLDAHATILENHVGDAGTTSVAAEARLVLEKPPLLTNAATEPAVLTEESLVSASELEVHVLPPIVAVSDSNAEVSELAAQHSTSPSFRIELPIVETTSASALAEEEGKSMLAAGDPLLVLAELPPVVSQVFLSERLNTNLSEEMAVQSAVSLVDAGVQVAEALAPLEVSLPPVVSVSSAGDPPSVPTELPPVDVQVSLPSCEAAKISKEMAVQSADSVVDAVVVEGLTPVEASEPPAVRYEELLSQPDTSVEPEKKVVVPEATPVSPDPLAVSLVETSGVMGAPAWDAEHPILIAKETSSTKVAVVSDVAVSDVASEELKASAAAVDTPPGLPVEAPVPQIQVVSAQSEDLCAESSIDTVVEADVSVVQAGSPAVDLEPQLPAVESGASLPANEGEMLTAAVPVVETAGSSMEAEGPVDKAIGSPARVDQ